LERRWAACGRRRKCVTYTTSVLGLVVLVFNSLFLGFFPIFSSQAVTLDARRRASRRTVFVVAAAVVAE
jgi:hypothetical protein